MTRKIRIRRIQVTKGWIWKQEFCLTKKQSHFRFGKVLRSNLLFPLEQSQRREFTQLFSLCEFWLHLSLDSRLRNSWQQFYKYLRYHSQGNDTMLSKLRDLNLLVLCLQTNFRSNLWCFQKRLCCFLVRWFGDQGHCLLPPSSNWSTKIGQGISNRSVGKSQLHLQKLEWFQFEQLHWFCWIQCF